MINPVELRIGNKVYFGNKIHTVTGNDIYKLQDGACFDENGIPLTEEWLLRFGFEKTQHEYGSHETIFSKDEIELSSDFRLVVTDYYVERIGKPLQYVHQLQNLFFALTGEELTIK